MAAYSEADARVIVELLRGVTGRLVVLSSIDVYRGYGRFHGKEQGDLQPVPFTEDAPLREALYPYRGDGRGLDDYEKILVERAASSAFDLPATILRLPMVYGERDYQRRLFIELKRMDDNRPAILLEETFAAWHWTRGYVENVAAAIALATADPRATGRVYNIGEAESRSYADWLRAVGQAAGWHGEVAVVPDGRLPEQLRPPAADYHQHLVSDTGRIRQELGYIEPVPLYQGLLRSIEWERANRGTPNERLFDYAAEDAVLDELRAEAAAVDGLAAEPRSPGTPEPAASEAREESTPAG
jgi:nucleoside-diphosphate-sugar epimerase